jgi:hypothetical protein
MKGWRDIDDAADDQSQETHKARTCERWQPEAVHHVQRALAKL